MCVCVCSWVLLPMITNGILLFSLCLYAEAGSHTPQHVEKHCHCHNPGPSENAVIVSLKVGPTIPYAAVASTFVFVDILHNSSERSSTLGR